MGKTSTEKYPVDHSTNSQKCYKCQGAQKSHRMEQQRLLKELATNEDEFVSKYEDEDEEGDLVGAHTINNKRYRVELC